MEGQVHGTNGPPTSQASGRAFVDSANQPLRVFVEAAELQSRPRVIRNLKHHGAAIAHDPAEASVILVDPQTTSGGQFVQDWSSEPGKVVLDVRWVQESIKRGRAFLAHDGWGGFCLSENASNTVQNPLPTPRETPSDAQASQADTMQNLPQFSMPAGTSASGYQFQQPSQQPQMTQHMPNGLPSGTAIPMAGMQTDPNNQVVVPAHIFAQLVGIASQQGRSSTSIALPQILPQMPMNMMPGQGMPQGYPQQALPFMSQPNVFAQPQYPLSQQPGMFPQQAMNPPFSYMPGSDTGPPNHYQSPTPATPDGNSSMYQARRQSSMSDTVRGSPMEDVRTPSLKRKSPSMDGGPRKAGKERADGRHSSKQRRVSYPTDEPPLPYPNATPPSTQARHDASSTHEKLFMNDDGEPYKFFVQIDIRPRTRIADAIKKNGGRLVPDIADADFVILGSPSTRTFEERLKQADSCGKSAVRPQWVFQCVEQNEIVDLDDYVFEGLEVVKKRGRPSATGKRFILAGPNSPSTSRTNKKRSDLVQDTDEDMAEGDEELQDPVVKEKAKPKGKGKAAVKEPVKKEKVEKKTDKSGAKVSSGAKTSKAGGKGKGTQGESEENLPPPPEFWRPSPPPPTRVVEHMPGKNMYTKEDLDYVDEYLPILFFRDPDITLSALSEKLHAKMPHHTQKSWQTHISHACRRDKYEKMRRQAHIARRKASAAGQRTSDRVDGEILQAEMPSDNHSAPVQENDAQASADDFDPFTVLSEFFAAGGADNLADSEVWGVLSAKYPQLSPQAWEAYWQENNEVVSEAVTRLSGVRNGLVEGTEAPMQYGDGLRIPKVEPE
ncbi:hypothetical protein OH77DRAFT_1417783 [Trametes cingulata]|nr:hypothetical protein OH77DRAFT_1417783 [Trametes cingulata]